VIKYKSMVAALAAGAFVTFAGLPMASDLGPSRAYADGVRKAKARYKKGYRATRVRGFVQRGGYYSYVDQDAINTTAWASSLFSSWSTFRNPLTTQQQSPGGPFDSGFFFDSDIGPPWNNSPYPR
jgi:hypothetical protein